MSIESYGSRGQVNHLADQLQEFEKNLSAFKAKTDTQLGNLEADLRALNAKADTFQGDSAVIGRQVIVEQLPAQLNSSEPSNPQPNNCSSGQIRFVLKVPETEATLVQSQLEAILKEEGNAWKAKQGTKPADSEAKAAMKKASRERFTAMKALSDRLHSLTGSSKTDSEPLHTPSYFSRYVEPVKRFFLGLWRILGSVFRK